jgi:hypothetical protein
MKKLTSILLLWMLLFVQQAAFGQQIVSGRHRKIFTATGSTVTYAGINCSINYIASASSVSCTVSGLSAGQTIYIESQWYTASLTATMGDSNGSTSVVSGPTTLTTQTGGDEMWVVKNTNSGSHVLTLTLSGTAAYPNIFAIVLSGASATSPTDSVATLKQSTGSPATLTSNGLTTTTSNEFLLVPLCGYSGGGVTISGGTSPQVMTLAINNGNMASMYGTAVTAGTNYATCILSGTGSNATTMSLVAVH